MAVNGSSKKDKREFISHNKQQPLMIYHACMLESSNGKIDTS